MADEQPYRILHEFYGETFRKAVYKALLAVFNEDLQKHYHVTGFAQMPDDKVVIRLEKDVFPKEEAGDPVRDTCREYLDWLRSGEYHGDSAGDYKQAIYEAAMEACFGPDVWEEVNILILASEN